MVTVHVLVLLYNLVILVYVHKDKYNLVIFVLLVLYNIVLLVKLLLYVKLVTHLLL